MGHLTSGLMRAARTSAVVLAVVALSAGLAQAKGGHGGGGHGGGHGGGSRRWCITAVVGIAAVDIGAAAGIVRRWGIMRPRPGISPWRTTATPAGVTSRWAGRTRAG